MCFSLTASVKPFHTDDVSIRDEWGSKGPIWVVPSNNSWLAVSGERSPWQPKLTWLVNSLANSLQDTITHLPDLLLSKLILVCLLRQMGLKWRIVQTHYNTLVHTHKHRHTLTSCNAWPSGSYSQCTSCLFAPFWSFSVSLQHRKTN